MIVCGEGDEQMADWMSPLQNVNRGYRKLIIWQDAIEYYALTCSIFRSFTYELRRVGSNQIASVDSIHGNIAEGYCRRSLNEYLQFLYIASGSLGESVSGLHAYVRADQITEDQFQAADRLSYKIENGMKKLIEHLQLKRESGEKWEDSFVIKESNAIYSITETEEQAI